MTRNARLVTALPIFYNLNMGEVSKEWMARARWLKQQAEQAFVWNKTLGYYEVLDGPDARISSIPDVCSAFKHSASWYAAHDNLAHNLMMRAWPSLREETRGRIAAFFAQRNLRNFFFLDYGGRAVVFRAQDGDSGRRRIARLEAPHSSRSVRAEHGAVLGAFASNEGNTESYEGVKLEILPEIVPLYKMPACPRTGWYEKGAADIYKKIYEISQGINMVYNGDMFDRDADTANVGILPDGKVVTLDPEFIFGVEAKESHKAFRRIWAELPQGAATLYGAAPGALFF